MTTKQRIRDAAIRLFTERGYNATSIADIQKEAGVQRGSLYFHYKSKEALAADALKTFFDSVGAALTARLAAPLPSPIDGLCEVFFTIRDQTVANGYRGGCLLGNFGQELAEDDPTRLLLKGYFDTLIDVVTVFFQKSRDCGELRAGIAPRGAARQFVTTFHGALIELRVYKDPAVFDEAMETLRRSLR